MMDAANMAGVRTPTWRDRLTAWLFPGSYLGPIPDEPGFAPGSLATRTFVTLDWLDRLRVLVSGKLVVAMRTKTDVPVTRCKSVSTFTVLAPWDHRI